MAAQSSPASIASNTTPEEKKEQVLALLGKYLTSQGINVEAEKLDQQFNDVDITAGDQDAILAPTRSFVATSLAGDEKKVDEVMEQWKGLMSMALPGLGIEMKPKIDGVADGVANGIADGANGTEVEVKQSETIQNVHLWKAGLPLSKGARPVVDLSTFEELGAKL